MTVCHLVPEFHKLENTLAIERLCPESDVEVDLNTGKLWGSTPTVYQAYEGSMWRPGVGPCSLSAVLAMDMTTHTAGKSFYYSEYKGPL